VNLEPHANQASETAQSSAQMLTQSARSNMRTPRNFLCILRARIDTMDISTLSRRVDS
jgi:hypothetical protein